MTYDDLVDQLMQFFSRGRYEEDVRQAKTVFFERTGFTDESTDDFENKMLQFVDWYLFSRPLMLTGRTPIQEALAIEEYRIPADQAPLYANLARAKHGLFEFLRISGKNDVAIRDSFDGKKYLIKNSKVTVGFNREEMFEARLIPDGDSFVFARAFCFHPNEAGKYIQKELKRIKKLPEIEQGPEKEALLLKLYKMRNVFDQYKHIDLGAIYSNESRFAN
jgi:hypothetical protein